MVSGCQGYFWLRDGLEKKVTVCGTQPAMRRPWLGRFFSASSSNDLRESIWYSTDASRSSAGLIACASCMDLDTGDLGLAERDRQGNPLKEREVERER